jgi:hypothetical protein
MLERTSAPPTPLVHTDDELVAHVRGSADMKNWYSAHTASMKSLLGEHAATFSLALAATSPRNKVGGNVTQAIRALHHIKHGLPFTGGLSFHRKNLEILRSGVQSGSTPRAIAARLGGSKVGPYAQAVMGRHDATPIDMHVSTLLWGKPDPSEREHREGAAHVRRIAGLVGWTPRQTQAAMWAANQRRNGTTVSTYEDYLKQPHIAERIRRVLSSTSPLPDLTEGVEGSPADVAEPDAEGLGSVLLGELGADPAVADRPLPPLAPEPLLGRISRALSEGRRSGKNAAAGDETEDMPSADEPPVRPVEPAPTKTRYTYAEVDALRMEGERAKGWKNIQPNPVGEHPVYRLTRVRVADVLNHHEGAGGQRGARAKEYASRPTPFPPITLMPRGAGAKRVTIDGQHRLEAARLRKDEYIAALEPDIA